MLNCWHDLVMSSHITRELIGEDRSSAVSHSLQQFAEAALSRFGVPSFLHQDIQHLTVLIDGAPQINELAVDLAENLMEVPGVAKAPSPTTQSARVGGAELQTPKPNRFIGDFHPALQHHFLDVLET